MHDHLTQRSLDQLHCSAHNVPESNFMEPSLRSEAKLIPTPWTSPYREKSRSWSGSFRSRPKFGFLSRTKWFLKMSVCEEKWLFRSRLWHYDSGWWKYIELVYLSETWERGGISNSQFKPNGMFFLCNNGIGIQLTHLLQSCELVYSTYIHTFYGTKRAHVFVVSSLRLSINSLMMQITPSSWWYISNKGFNTLGEATFGEDWVVKMEAVEGSIRARCRQSYSQSHELAVFCEALTPGQPATFRGVEHNQNKLYSKWHKYFSFGTKLTSSISSLRNYAMRCIITFT